ncbi:bacillithiol system redox-active protein YtxJ [Aquibacillus rhizosphaerae]|uniref:Bacillithiol system redox-active protein YtxJ n=1 Tax=Aquibacillus rhizosphaerae TaxID=3051431 RepID=A0ABT7L2D9_9BACI|nr:bacillithiol system redox-active protein YtxJ [Aquibacillus sp. LR5S19]MDL4839377.1 bacillithiol system redox-active protein YtxJ [Aquibacillus sp. LR5S19]
MDIKVIETEEQFKEILDEKDVFILMKHSLTCPISSEAKKEYDNFSVETKLPLYILYVQEARELSNIISNRYHIKHESPQALLFSNKKVIWHDSHSRITRNQLKMQLENI